MVSIATQITLLRMDDLTPIGLGNSMLIGTKAMLGLSSLLPVRAVTMVPMIFKQ